MVRVKPPAGPRAIAQKRGRISSRPRADAWTAAVTPGRSGTGRAVHLHLVEGVAVRGAPRGAVHPDVAAGTGQARQVVGGTVAGGGRVDRRPGRAVGGRLDR